MTAAHEDDIELGELVMRRLAQQDQEIAALRAEVAHSRAGQDELFGSMEHMFGYLSNAAASVRRYS